jgi:polynucleotide 5'-hydroxyl-kinase GRC3/NOL9
VTRQLKDTSGVACLDLDPGQPEYGLPGTLSLVHVIKPNLRPSFTRTINNDWTKSIIRCHAIASVSPASDPDLYRSCVIDLYKTYCSELSDKPLVINTPGWILGTGLELLGEIIELTDTNEVVYMSEEGPAETVDALRASTRNTFSTLPSQPSEASSRTAAQFRSMHTMCYFHQHPAELASNSGRASWKTSPLTAEAPLQVRFSGPDSGIDGILTYHSQSPSELLAETICGMVLAVVEIEDLRAYGQLLGDHSPKPTILRTPEGLPYISNPHDITLDPTFCRSIGLVLVRGVDAKTQTLQILTPISLNHIDNIKQAGHSIVLVHGKFDVPGWAYTEDLYNRSDVKDDSPEQFLEAGGEENLGDDSASLAQAPHMVDQETSFPWVEVLKGNQRRPTGSRVWRVRRDLGRKGGDG